MNGDVAIDLGTANTVVYVRGSGVVLDEPSAVAVNARTGRLLAAGNEAKEMLGRTPPHITAIRPLEDGVVSDLNACERMLHAFIERVRARRWMRPRKVICVPSGVTGVEQRAVQEVAESAGARKPVHVIEEPIAAAIGAGLPVQEPIGNMIVDIGGGTTEVAVISLGGVVASQSVRTAGDEIDDAIVTFARKEYGLGIGVNAAEHLKIAGASAWPLREELCLDVGGSALDSGLPKTVTVSTAEIRDAIEAPVTEVVDAVRHTLDYTPPELVADVMQQGIVLTGGGALIPGLDTRISHEMDMPVSVADHPLHSVVLGAGRYLESL
jgi:rod shape-determining protein MreB and related proteins